MRFSTGLLDWLFGEKVTIDLPDGRKRTVTKRWWAEMERQGKVRPVTPGTATNRVPVGEISPASLFKHAEFIAMMSLTSLEERLPAFRRLTARDGLDNWSFCFAIAFAYTATRYAPEELSDQEFETFREAVQRFIPTWRPDGVEGFNNLHGLIQMGRGVPYQASLGMWVLWNLAGNRPTQQDEIQLAGVLGALIETHVGEWWKLAGA